MRFATLILLSASATLGASSPPPDEPRLALPLDCRFGETCFVQQYKDHDPGPGAKDYRCGGQSYDGHSGVDLRVPTIAAQRRGVAVLAAAAGAVRNFRDGVPDQVVTDANRASIEGRECGNGVVIAHLGGWETQYCHMAMGSVAVKRGQALRAGEPLGRVGLSGDTQFPHLHVTVRRGATEVDPFAVDAAPGACGGGRSLWTPQAAAALAYKPAAIINSGFVDGPTTMAEVEEGTRPAPGRNAPALVFYARAIGLEKGDDMRLTLRGPDGAELADNAVPMDRNKAQYFLFAGKRRPAQGWAAGRYVGESAVVRGGRVVARRTAELTL